MQQTTRFGLWLFKIYKQIIQLTLGKVMRKLIFKAFDNCILCSTNYSEKNYIGIIITNFLKAIKLNLMRSGK